MGVSFPRQTPMSDAFETGADARFPSEVRQLSWLIDKGPCFIVTGGNHRHSSVVRRVPSKLQAGREELGAPKLGITRMIYPGSSDERSRRQTLNRILPLIALPPRFN